MLCLISAYMCQATFGTPSNLKLFRQVNSFVPGPVEDFTNFINAVIDEKSFDKIAGYIDNAKNAGDASIIAGGKYDKSKGYFIWPTIIETTNPSYVTLCEEIFGPVLTVYGIS